MEPEHFTPSLPALFDGFRHRRTGHQWRRMPLLAAFRVVGRVRRLGRKDSA